MSPIPEISKPRLAIFVQPDQKCPRYGVRLPDLLI